MKQIDGVVQQEEVDLGKALTDLERLFGIHITVHDSQANFFDENGCSFFGKRYYHQAPYCLDGRYDIPEWNDKCKLDCAFTAESVAHRKHKSFFHSCWKGVTELIVPIEENNMTMLLFYAGPFRSKTFPSELPIEWQDKWHKLPPVPEHSEADTLTRMLLLLGHGMLHYISGCRGKSMPTSRRGLIRKYLDDHAFEEITFADLCRELALSPARTRVLVNHHFGVSFRKLLEMERMLRAEQLLLTSELPLKQIAEAVGFRNEFHFNRAFRNHFGSPPGKYRESRQQ